jgi:prevent-host-death family protein
MKTETYSTYQAKAQFSEIIRKVMRNKRIIITQRGRPVAEIGPISHCDDSIEEHLRRLADDGIISSSADSSPSSIGPIERRQGALDRFLADRD